MSSPPPSPFTGDIPVASVMRVTMARKMAPTLVATPALLAWRIRRGFVQKVLADRAGVDRATVARLEQGGVGRLDTITKLAAALDCTPADLMALAER